MTAHVFSLAGPERAADVREAWSEAEIPVLEALGCQIYRVEGLERRCKLEVGVTPGEEVVSPGPSPT